MFRRRGCLFGCGGLLMVCVIVSGIGWFFGIPRAVDALRDEVADGVSTIVADNVHSLYSRSELQQGQDVRLSFNALNVELQDASDDADNLDSLKIVGRGYDIVMSASVSGQSYDIAFTPSIGTNGHLNLIKVDEGGWWQQQTMKVLGGGFEKSINTWLDENGLVLTDVTVESDAIILTVTGR